MKKDKTITELQNRKSEIEIEIKNILDVFIKDYGIGDLEINFTADFHYITPVIKEIVRSNVEINILL